jgi:hypothetical protein
MSRLPRSTCRSRSSLLWSPKFLYSRRRRHLDSVPGAGGTNGGSGRDAVSGAKGRKLAVVSIGRNTRGSRRILGSCGSCLCLAVCSQTVVANINLEKVD